MSKRATRLHLGLRGDLILGRRLRHGGVGDRLGTERAGQPVLREIGLGPDVGLDLLVDVTVAGHGRRRAVAAAAEPGSSARRSART